MRCSGWRSWPRVNRGSRTRLARVHARDLRLHFLALPADDRRLRFGRSMNDAAIRNYVARIDFARDAVFGVFDTDLTLIGVAHLARGDDAAELGLSVLPTGRRGGMAASLLDRAITHARACGITLLTLHCMSENEPMRRLAQRAAQAAREIKALVGAIVDKVETGSRLVGDAGSTMREIVYQVKRVSDLIAEITSSTLEESSGIGQVNQAVTQLDQMTQQNAALVEQSAAAAQSLREQAGKLAQAVAVFKLSSGGAA